MFHHVLMSKNVKKSQVPSGFRRNAWPEGVVLLEAAAFWPSCKFLGLELDQQQLASRLRRIGYGYWSRHPILNSLSVYVCIIYVACPCITPQNITNEVWTKNFQVTEIYTSRQSAVTEEVKGRKRNKKQRLRKGKKQKSDSTSDLR